jgi:hypothetical protein
MIKVTLDHVHPKSKGGPLSAWNTAWCCERCNNEKGNKLIRDWLGELLVVQDQRAPIVEAFIAAWEQRPQYRELGPDKPAPVVLKLGKRKPKYNLPPVGFVPKPRRVVPEPLASRLTPLPMPEIPSTVDREFWLEHVSKRHCVFCARVGGHTDSCVLARCDSLPHPRQVANPAPEG